MCHVDVNCHPVGRGVAATFKLRPCGPFSPKMLTFPPRHDSRSERLSWGNQLVAGLGSPLPAIINSNDQKLSERLPKNIPYRPRCLLHFIDFSISPSCPLASIRGSFPSPTSLRHRVAMSLPLRMLTF